MKIAVAADHAGWQLKDVVASQLVADGHEVIDLGTNSEDSVDYPDFGEAVGRAVVNGEAQLGVAVCGSGIGICMAAGKVKGIRAATVHDVTSARLSREHNNANVVCLGARFIGPQVAMDAVQAFLAAEFSGGRHAKRVAKINNLDSD